LANDTYGPRSSSTISQPSSSRRSRAAVDAPPATPPTINTRRLIAHLHAAHRNEDDERRRILSTCSASTKGDDVEPRTVERLPSA
jgi:hypothetical protein